VPPPRFSVLSHVLLTPPVTQRSEAWQPLAVIFPITRSDWHVPLFCRERDPPDPLPSPEAFFSEIARDADAPRSSGKGPGCLELFIFFVKFFFFSRRPLFTLDPI